MSEENQANTEVYADDDCRSTDITHAKMPVQYRDNSVYDASTADDADSDDSLPDNEAIKRLAVISFQNEYNIVSSDNNNSTESSSSTIGSVTSDGIDTNASNTQFDARNSIGNVNHKSAHASNNSKNDIVDTNEIRNTNDNTTQITKAHLTYNSVLLPGILANKNYYENHHYSYFHNCDTAYHSDGGNTTTATPSSSAVSTNNSNSNSSSSSAIKRREGRSKSVSFAAGTAAPALPGVAVGIIRHEYTEDSSGSGYMEYMIQVWQNSRSWTIGKRYSQFEILGNELNIEFEKTKGYGHKEAISSSSNTGPNSGVNNAFKRTYAVESSKGVVISNNANNMGNLPQLPKKRWFETQRWMNRHDHMYAFMRRQALQEYLKLLVKVPDITTNSISLQRFLNLDKTATNSSYESFGGGVSANDDTLTESASNGNHEKNG